MTKKVGRTVSGVHKEVRITAVIPEREERPCNRWASGKIQRKHNEA